MRPVDHVGKRGHYPKCVICEEQSGRVGLARSWVSVAAFRKHRELTKTDIDLRH